MEKGYGKGVGMREGRSKVKEGMTDQKVLRKIYKDRPFLVSAQR